MFQKLYTILIRPRQQSEDDRNREIVLNVLLAGTLLILILALPLLSIGYLLLHHDYISPSMLMVTTAVLFIGFLYRLSRMGHFRSAAALLVGMYFLLATTVLFLWGINVPAGVLLFGLVIVLAGILLGPNHSLYSAAGVAIVLVTLELADTYNLIDPDVSWVTEPPSMGDVVGFC